jgi:hypothetical protein
VGHVARLNPEGLAGVNEKSPVEASALTTPKARVMEDDKEGEPVGPRTLTTVETPAMSKIAAAAMSRRRELRRGARDIGVTRLFSKMADAREESALGTRPSNDGPACIINSSTFIVDLL